MGETHYGFFSAEAADRFGGVIEWSSPGGPVRVTCVSSDPEAAEYLWPDKVCLGPVERFERVIVPSRVHNPNMSYRGIEWRIGGD